MFLNIDFPFFAEPIRQAHQYAGEDVEKKIDSAAQILYAEMRKIHEYAGFFKESLARSKGGL